MSEIDNSLLYDDDNDDYSEWDAVDELAEDINDILIDVNHAAEDGDLGHIALLGLKALALESWHDMYTFKSYADACREVWVKALTVYDDIAEARQQG